MTGTVSRGATRILFPNRTTEMLAHPWQEAEPYIFVTPAVFLELGNIHEEMGESLESPEISWDYLGVDNWGLERGTGQLVKLNFNLVRSKNVRL